MNSHYTVKLGEPTDGMLQDADARAEWQAENEYDEEEAADEADDFGFDDGGDY